MENPVVLVTGATGIVGSALMAHLRRAFPSHTIVPLSRTGAVPADLCRPDFGLQPERILEMQSRTAVIVHCAAATRFNLPIEEARAINVEGTRRMLGFAVGCPRLEQFAHVSTLYIAGRRSGWVREQPLDHEDGYFNTYEQSKHEAEQIVLAESSRLPVAIYRLSSVVPSGSRRGHIHQVLRLAPHCAGFPMIPADPGVPVDIIGAEWAARALAFLLRQTFHSGQVLNICAGLADSLTVKELIDLALEAWEQQTGRALNRPRLVSLPEYERFGGRGMEPLMTFLPHLSVSQPFDGGSTRRLLDDAGIRPAPVRELLDQALAQHFLPPGVLS